MLTLISEKFNLTIKWAPIVGFLTEFLGGSVNDELAEYPFDYGENHIYYLRKATVEAAIKYDELGVNKIKRYIHQNEVRFYLVHYSALVDDDWF